MDTAETSPTSGRLPARLAGRTGGRHSNLALALVLLPPDRRKDAFLFYDFCRAVDDVADSSERNAKEKQAILDAWLAALQPSGEANLPEDFRNMISRRQLDRHLLSEIVRGMRMDTEGDGESNRYATAEDLRTYCWRVASAVGLISARLFGAQGPAVTRYAEALGLALQFTNILRDVAEDAAMRRIYIPREDLKRFAVSEQEILERSHSSSSETARSAAITHLLNFQAERADAFFAKAELAWSEMSPNQRRLMRPARLMSAIYRDLLLQMRRDRYDVFQKNYRVSRIKKLLLALRVLTGK